MATKRPKTKAAGKRPATKSKTTAARKSTAAVRRSGRRSA